MSKSYCPLPDSAGPPIQDCPGEGGEAVAPAGEEEPSTEVESELNKHLLQFHTHTYMSVHTVDPL